MTSSATFRRPSSDLLPPLTITALAAIAALGPFASDMYLSSLPAIGNEFNAPGWIVQFTLTGYLLFLGAAQLIVGPLTDAFGRRRPVLMGLVLFISGSLLAAVSPSISVLVLARVLQGAGGAMTLVVMYAYVRDRTTGSAATRNLALLLTVSAIAPVIAPIAGGFLEVWFGWRSVFVVLALAGVATLLLAIASLPESLPKVHREPLRLRTAARGYGDHLRNRKMVHPLFALALLFALLFGYIGGASFVYQEQFGLGATTFSILFGVTGCALVVGAWLAHRLAHRYSERSLALVGAVAALVGSSLAFAGFLSSLHVGVIAAGMGLILFGLGASEPAILSMIMSAAARDIGSASALVGSANHLLGAAATAVIGGVAASSGSSWSGALVVVAAAVTVLIILIPRTPAVGSQES